MRGYLKSQSTSCRLPESPSANICGECHISPFETSPFPETEVEHSGSQHVMGAGESVVRAVLQLNKAGRRSSEQLILTLMA